MACPMLHCSSKSQAMALARSLIIDLTNYLRQFVRLESSMGHRKNVHGLWLPCECVSVHHGYSDPWASIAHDKLLNDGTKERILNSVAHRPKTIAGLAKELGLSQQAIHNDIGDLLSSQLLRESRDWKKRHPAENYYEPNFPIIKAGGRAAFDQICQSI